ncbi:hypothetical protein [Nocardioides sp. MH1]|uniref:hypothetical protein n=1 Tax=Nocardioides sp. MH1 TaxID=3242490 RepID=UPI003520D9BB
MPDQPESRFAHWKDVDPGRPSRRWVTLAVGVLAVGALVYGGVRLLDYWIDTPEPPVDPPRAEVGYFRQDLLRPGDCFSDADLERASRVGSDDAVGTVPAVQVVRCDRPHTAEVYARFDIPESGDYPGSTVIGQAGAGCDDALAEYAGASGDDLTIWLLPPTLAAWERGQGHGLCVAVSARRRRGSLNAAGA